MEAQHSTIKLKATCELQYQLEIPPIYKGVASTVYRAMDLTFARRVAIKEIPLKTMSKNDSRALRSEVNTYCQCGALSNHIPQIYNQFEQNGNLYIVMQWVQGRSLREVLDEDKRGVKNLCYDDKLNLAIQLCQILEPIHKNKIQHRDLRPENLQVVGSDYSRLQMWLLDFNISAAVPRREQGSMGYLAPELSGISSLPGIGGKSVDVFAIGVIMYEMFTGDLPFYGDHYYNTAPNDIEWTQFIKPSELNPQLPPMLDNIIEKCMRLNWRERYTNAGQIGRELELLRKKGGRSQNRGRGKQNGRTN